eukprot:g70081.t1
MSNVGEEDVLLSASTSRKGSCGSVSWWQLGLAAWMVAITAAVVLTNGSAPATNDAEHMMISAKAKEAKGDSDGMDGMGFKGSQEGCGYFGQPVSYFLSDGEYPEYIYDSDDFEYCDWFSDEPFTVQLLINTNGTGFMSLADNYDQGENDAFAECEATGWTLTPAVISSGALFPDEEINATCWYNPAGVGRYLFEMRPVLSQCYSEILTTNPNGIDKGSILYRTTTGSWDYDDNSCFMALNSANLKAFNVHFATTAANAVRGTKDPTQIA